MKSARIAGIAIAGGLAFATPLLASAQGMPGDGPRMPMRSEFHRAHGQHGGFGEQGGFGEHGMAGHRLMRGLGLTEAQRDKVFAVMHANAPAMREQEKALRTSRAELARLAVSKDYDDAKARALADRHAQASAAMAQLRARGMNEIYRVLTPEQQAKVAERLAQWEQRGARPGPRMQGGPARL